jgi:hypothetical protein
MHTILNTAILACLVAASVASAQLYPTYTPFWKASEVMERDPYWDQASVPGTVACFNANPIDANYTTPCYGSMGGYWYSYEFNGGAVQDWGSGTVLNASTAIQTQEWSDAAGSRVEITGRGFNHYTPALDVRLITAAGSDEEPSGAGIGFYWRNKDGDDWDGKAVENITSAGTGLCVRYRSDVAGVVMELAWPSSYGDNVWVVALPAASSWNTVDAKWTDFQKSYESDTDQNPLSTALTYAEAVKFAYKNKSSSPVTVHLEIAEVGWSGDCSGTAGIMQASGKPISSFSFIGRTLSLVNAAAPATVQVINMHGVLVAQKTLAPSENLSLASLPVGVYLVRSKDLGISQKITVK